MKSREVMLRGASPSPKVLPKGKEKEQMTFLDALAHAIKGSKIHKMEWASKDFYAHRSNSMLMLHKPDGKDYQWIISDGDMFGEDWIVL